MIFAVSKSDLSAIENVIDSTELFPSEMMDALLADYFNGNPKGEICLTHSAPAALLVEIGGDAKGA